MKAKTKTVDIRAEARSERGKGAARALRRSGGLPAVLYGEGGAPVTLTLDLAQVERALAARGGERAILALAVDGAAGKPQLAMFKEIQHETISRELLHVDLLRVSLDKKVEVKVPVELLNAELVKRTGGIIQQNVSEIAVECLPDNIPESVQVDVGGCGIGDAVTVRELIFGEGIAVLAEADEVIASVVAPAKVEEKPAEAVEAAPAEGAEAEKKEGEEEEKKHAKAEAADKKRESKAEAPDRKTEKK
ncbi:MAG: 50S ribosomal protein L25 [bacterium]